MPVAGTLQCNQVLHSRASSIRSSRTRRALATAPNARVPNASNGELHTSSLAAKHVNDIAHPGPVCASPFRAKRAQRARARAARRVKAQAPHSASPTHSSYYGDPQPESVSVTRNPQIDGRDACGVGFLARLNGNREHAVLQEAVSSLGCVEHRGACSADNDSGDGAGIMSEIPWKMFNRWLSENNCEPLEEGKSAVGMIFLPQDSDKQATGRDIIQRALEREQLKVLAWREPPLDRSMLGSYASAAEPKIEQVLVKDVSGNREQSEIDRALFLAKKTAEREVIESNDQLLYAMCYICSLSTSTIVYKGMLRSAVLGHFYLDLQDSDYETSWCIYHRRFSTNTNPAWPLAQPFRMVGHNGEINTLMGNLNWVRTREGDFKHPLWDGREEDLRPVVDPAASDSANLDRLAELLVNTERPVEETMMLLVPEAHENNPTLDQHYPEARHFYDFYAGTQEAWDGPALLVFSDGRKLGCRLDRNGLRPARFWYTSDTVFVASEVGVQPNVIEEAKDVRSKGRLGPGQMVVVDTQTGEFKENAQVAREVAQQRPYGEWLQNRQRLSAPRPQNERELEDERLVALQAAAGWSSEDLSMVLESMATDGKEPVFCMGDDTPLSPLSERSHSLFNYFKQRFAQVTNPAIDPLREGTVMSLEMCLGGRGDLLQPSAEDANQIVIDSPVLMDDQLATIKADPQMNASTLSAFYNCNEENGLKKSLDDLRKRAEDAVMSGSKCLVISDRYESADENHPAIPALLAVGAVHHHLINRKIRSQCSIVSECMHAHSTHHLATLVGYGAEAVNPWLAFESARAWRLSKRTQNLIEKGKLSPVSIEEAQKNVVKALNAGLKKILSKIGIGLVSSYHGAQIFECFGLGQDVIDYAFTGTDARIGGLSFEEVSAEVADFWKSAMPSLSKLPATGFFQPKPGLEYHGNNQEMSKLLHKAIGLGGKQPSPDAYELYQEHRADRPVTTLRDCLDIVSDREPIDISEVESAADIVSRFCTGGMSLGAISRECHEVIGIAMNRIGGKSNSGEGGEDPDRYIELEDVDDEGNSPTFPHLRGLRNGDFASSKIKQVASGRFGVTPEFLASSKQLEIKIAQGAKPGEGGQLPGKKVSPYIAMLRRSKPGVPLISPPPHHDIYSIEDLAQLIFDLHQANSRSQVSVKLVASEGIGTVASGVAKANADVIQVSGHDGGTGASPVSSIKHAGAPFELGLMETHEALLENGLRDRVVLRTDGGIRSGYDVMQAAMLGADEYGFGTISMIATGCIMARVCHTNNCPVGVASQREELRARFPGAPSDLVNFFHFVAEEVRQTLARMGYRSMDEIIGRADLLQQRNHAVKKTKHLDMSYLTRCPGLPESTSSERIAQEAHSNGPVFDDQLLADKDISDAIRDEGDVTKNMEVRNVDRAVGGRLGPTIAAKYGDEGFAGTININFIGSGGQSFGAWLVKGVHFALEGEANDYVGKGMAGGSIAIRPPEERMFKAEESVLVGNTCLYGATGGQLFVNGRAGERFAVRNSMAEAVVEGTGDHCCEYMTGGCVIVLGSVGRNTGAGMTGGITYIYDEANELPQKLNDEIVTMQRVQSQAGERQLRQLVEDHAQRTGSERAHALLRSWDECLQNFWQLVPPSEADTPEASPEPEPASGEPAPAPAASKA